MRAESFYRKTRRAPLRAPPACSMAESMARAACGKSRSAVNAGPRSERASTVRRSRRKLFFCAATQGGSRKVQSTKRVTRSQTGEGGGLLVSLVRQFRREYHCGLGRNEGQTVTHSVLITGGAGFIGRHAHAGVVRQGWGVLSIDSQTLRP